MYVPNYFSIEDNKVALEFIQSHSFGMLLCNGTEQPEVTHLPFILKEEGKDVFLYTHLAKANPHWKTIEMEGNVLLIFTGPHGYISPSWYANKTNVPTWNYTAVHVSGEAELIHETELKRQILMSTIEFFEPSYIQHFEQLPEQYKSVMYTEIVGIKIRLTSIQTKFKLNQNKTKEDISGVMEKLNALGNTELAKMMLKFNQAKLS
ncbi:MAG: FMN-binding negative transcriptional regulator [Bacteroidia bacterium]